MGFHFYHSGLGFPILSVTKAKLLAVMIVAVSASAYCMGCWWHDLCSCLRARRYLCRQIRRTFLCDFKPKRNMEGDGQMGLGLRLGVPMEGLEYKVLLWT